MELAYLYDDTFDGLLSAVFATYKRREEPYIIATGDNLQVMFGQEVVAIDTDFSHARRVESGIRKVMGADGWEAVRTAYLSHDGDRATKIYRYIRLGMKIGRAVATHLSHEDVQPILDMNRHTGNEAHLLTGFVRFSLMENGVYFARITPKNNVMPLILPHFAERFGDQPFLIHDPVHQIAGVFDLRDSYMVETDALNLPELAEGEEAWQKMWKRFYETIAIKERTNPKLRRTHMPMRYWHNMTEMNPLL
ncbi:TIGR03915 family putative DNA repair protein [Ruminococcaceae bacterium OttesenSCG-928-L11]|nr:TIGR03915 family putative DNA repair protein [Ruminococcaceae bacterium OttesenSCG-928-L11]